MCFNFWSVNFWRKKDNHTCLSKRNRSLRTVMLQCWRPWCTFMEMSRYNVLSTSMVVLPLVSWEYVSRAPHRHLLLNLMCFSTMLFVYTWTWYCLFLFNQSWSHTVAIAFATRVLKAKLTQIVFSFAISKLEELFLWYILATSMFSFAFSFLIENFHLLIEQSTLRRLFGKFKMPASVLLWHEALTNQWNGS